MLELELGYNRGKDAITIWNGGIDMNVIQCDEKNISLTEINQFCKNEGNLVIVKDDGMETLAIMNKKLLDKIALSSFLSTGFEAVKKEKFVDGESFFDDLERELANG